MNVEGIELPRFEVFHDKKKLQLSD